jgi:hypothetical protein
MAREIDNGSPSGIATIKMTIAMIPTSTHFIRVLSLKSASPVDGI